MFFLCLSLVLHKVDITQLAIIPQISAGCHHNALITRDGSLYTWGRNFDGQIGNGTRRDVSIPTPLYYNSASIFAQVPPRHNDLRRAQNRQDLDDSAKSSDSSSNGNASETNGNVSGASKSTDTEHVAPSRERINPVINTVAIACGYDYTVAIQPGKRKQMSKELATLGKIQ